MGLSLEEVVKQTGYCERTIRRWIKKGCNIDDPESLKEFAGQGVKFTPRKHLEGKPTAIISATESEDGELTGVLPPPTDQGAAAALKRLQEVEPMMYSRMAAAIKTGRVGMIQPARDDWLKVSDALRKYEEAVELSKRDSNEKIPKSEASEALRAGADWMRLAFQAWLSSESQNLVALDDPHSFVILARSGIKRAMIDAFEKSQDAQSPIPVWALETLNEAWSCSEI